MSSTIDIRPQLVAREFALKVAIPALQKNIREKNPTGFGARIDTERALNSLRYRFKQEASRLTLQIISDMPGVDFNYFLTLETGRGPSRGGGSGGGPTLRENIESWLQRKGINPPDISQKSLAYLIARKIHREGDLLYRQGGNSGIISTAITPEMIDEHLLKPIAKMLAEGIGRAVTT